MKNSIKKGLGFGLTSGIITTLGLMIGLYASTNSSKIILGGIIIIAIADALSDSLGMHISEEANSANSKEQIWEATLSTFLFKFIFALIFIIPILLLNLQTAIIVSIILGIFLITIFSYYIAKSNKDSPIKAIIEHLFITVIVIITTYFIGKFINSIFGI